MYLDVVEFSSSLTRLVDTAKISKDTATSYLSCIRILSDYVEKGEEIEIGEAVKSKTGDLMLFRKYMNAIRKYEEIVLKKPQGLISKNHEYSLINEYKKKQVPQITGKELNEAKMKRKINGIHDEKTRLTLRLELKSGLRVSEIAKLESTDLEFKEGDIFISVVEGKGGKSRQVKVIEDSYLYERLQAYIGKSNKGVKLFGSRHTISKKSNIRDIETHDLRRLNARMRLNTEMKTGKNFKHAREVVKEELGHSLPSTTDIYLDRKGRGGKTFRGNGK